MSSNKSSDRDRNKDDKGKMRGNDEPMRSRRKRVLRYEPPPKPRLCDIPSILEDEDEDDEFID